MNIFLGQVRFEFLFPALPKFNSNLTCPEENYSSRNILYLINPLLMAIFSFEGTHEAERLKSQWAEICFFWEERKKRISIKEEQNRMPKSLMAGWMLVSTVMIG